MTGPIIRPGSTAVNVVTGATDQVWDGLQDELTGSYVQRLDGSTVLAEPLTYVNVADFGAVDDWNGTTGTDNTAAIQAADAAAYAVRAPLHFPRTNTGAYLVTGNLIDGNGTRRSYCWEGAQSERGLHAEAASSGYSAVRIVYRPSDTSMPMIRCYSTIASLSAIQGPYIHRNLHFDVGDAHGLVFGVEDPADPTTVAPTTPATVADGSGQRYIFGVRFEGCALRGSVANRVSDGNGVITRSGKRLLSLVKSFETNLDGVSFSGGDTQLRTWGCDKPTFRNVRMGYGHLPMDLNGSGSFGVQHTIDSVQFEGWTFTPIRSRGCAVAGSNLRWEQNDGNPTGSGRYALPGTVAVTADSATLTFTDSMTGVLFPELSILELTDGTNTTTALVSTVSGTTVTIDVTTTTLTWTAAAATATRIHGVGPFHSGEVSATYTNCSPGASTNCPAAVWLVGRGSMTFTGCAPVTGAYADIKALPLGNRHGDQANLQGAMMFTGCSPLFAGDPANPFVAVADIRAGVGFRSNSANERARYGSFTDAELALRRKWILNPKTAWAVSNSSRCPVVRLPDETNTDQAVWAWHIRTASFYLQDGTLPSLSTSLVRIRVRAATVSGAGSLTLNYYGGSGSAGPTFTLSSTLTTFETIVPMPTPWQGVRTATGTVGFQITDDNVYLVGILVEEITVSDLAAFPGGVQTKVKAGIPADADFPTTPRDGMTVADSTNNRLYVRVGGAWKYTALT